MCSDCGHSWCVVGCPSYRAEEDPRFRGYCERCGRALYRDGKLCSVCEEEEENEWD